jgi:hypothetical protein
MIDTRHKIYLILINTKDHQIARREIRMRLRYRPDFESVYQDMLIQGVIEEFGAGKKNSTKTVRLLKSDM